MDFLLALNNRKYQESWPWLDGARNEKRPASPPCGFSTLTTSAPSQASASVQDGPASNWVRSRTRTPVRQLGSAPSLPISSFLPLGRAQHEWKSAYGVATLRNSGRSVTVRSAQLKHGHRFLQPEDRRALILPAGRNRWVGVSSRRATRLRRPVVSGSLALIVDELIKLSCQFAARCRSCLSTRCSSRLSTHCSMASRRMAFITSGAIASAWHVSPMKARQLLRRSWQAVPCNLRQRPMWTTSHWALLITGNFLREVVLHRDAVEAAGSEHRHAGDCA